MNTSDKLQNQKEPITERIMSKADELELRRYFIKALIWVSCVAVSIIISVGGFLYKKMDERLNENDVYRKEHAKENRDVMIEYASRISRLETDMQTVQEALKETRGNQQEILAAIRALKGELK